jgi:superfamily II DNA or RNA helicase
MLFIAHREEILDQSCETFKKFIKDRTFGFYQGNKKEIEKNYLFGSIQTIGKKNELEKFKKDEFEYIVIDEFHHAGAKSYKNLIEYFEPKFLLGLTATPNRSDNIDILQFLGNNLLYRKDLIDGINANLLSNFDYHGINDKHVDYTKITWRGKKFDEAELDNSLNTEARANYIFQSWNKLKQSRTLAFCSSIKQSDFMASFFSKKNIRAVSVHSKSKINRSDAISKLKSNEIDIIFSIDLFNEGIDIPAVDTILMARPTESKIIFLQQFGRGLRIAKGKKIVRVIDFIGNHKSFLEKPSALFGFDLNHSNIRKFINDYENNNLELPKESRILFDTESIEFMKELTKTKIDVVKMYQEFKDTNKERPTASEYYQFIDKISNLKLQYGSWFEFVKSMNDLDKEELETFNINKEFLKDLEKMKMTKSFKMIVLDLLCQNDFKDYNLDKLSKDSFKYIKETTNLWNEIPSEFKKDELNNDEQKKWNKYWLYNPIQALIKTSSKFYKLENNQIKINFDKKSNILVLKKLTRELINYRFISYKISFDLSYVELGQLNKDYRTQVGKAFSKTDVPRLFNFKGDAANEGYYKMFGHARPPGVPHQFIFITLIKASMAAEHRYHDYFKSENIFHWQSRKETTQNNDAGLAVINHKAKGELIHLFVRKMSSINGRTLPFTYCGEVNYKSVNGNAPINVDFELKKPLNQKLKQEFLRL